MWPAWADVGERGLEAVLDRQPDWVGWDDWSGTDKQAGLARLLDAWFPAETAAGAEVDRVAWVREDGELVDRLTANWPSWDSPGGGGLAPFLDEQPDWAGWDTWESGPRREYLARALDAWYPPADAEPATETDPFAWVRADTALVARLDEVWPAWAQPDDSGLLAVLSGTPEWTGWEAWNAEQQRSYLSRTLVVWYPADTAPPEPMAATDKAHTELAAALNEALATIPGAADLSPDEIRRILTEVLTEELAAQTPATPKAG